MLNKSQLMHLKSARKKQLKKGSQLKLSSQEQKQIIIHNLTNPVVNPLKLNLHNKHDYQRQQNKVNQKSNSTSNFVITTRTFNNNSFSRYRRKNKTTISSQEGFGHQSISQKELSRLKQLINKMKMNLTNTSKIHSQHLPKMYHSQISIKTFSYNGRLSISSRAEQAKLSSQNAKEFQSFSMSKRRYVKVPYQPKILFRTLIQDKQKKFKPKEEEQKGLRLTLSGWATKQEHQI